MATEEEDEAQWYRVCLNTIIREGVSLDSERLSIRPMGSMVLVVDTQGRRVKIVSPIIGWASKESNSFISTFLLFQARVKYRKNKLKDGGIY